LIGSSAELVAILLHLQCTPFWNPFQTRNLRPCHLGPFWNAACTMPQVRSASGRRSTSPQPRRIFPQRPGLFGAAQEFKKLLQPNQTQALRQTLSVSTVQSSSALARAWRYPAARLQPEPMLDPIRETSPHPDGAIPDAFLQPGETDPLYLFACHIEWERREDTGRCSSVPVISPAQGRVRRAGLAGSEDALTPRRTT
jgi:hypothetical protein